MDDVVFAEWLDMAWMSLLDRGNHGFADASKWRRFITAWVYDGEILEEFKAKAEDEKAKAAKEAVGKPAPLTAIQQARAMRERMGQKAQAATE